MRLSIKELPMPDVPSVVGELVEKFDRNRDQYLKQAYNEAQTRNEFIDPLFEALGWDCLLYTSPSPRDRS